MNNRCVIIAGEMSADILGYEIISSNSNVDWYGVGGPYMNKTNFKSILNWKKIGGFGLVEIILKLPFLFYNAHILANRIIKIKPKLIVTVDTKGFNFFLIKLIRSKLKLKSYKPRFIHLVAPTVWAWRPKRAKTISKLVDTLLCLFPKEIEYFKNLDLETKFVGHPAVQTFILEGDREKLYSKLGLKDNNEIIISLLPGSRASEVKKILPILILTTKILKSKIRKPLLFLCQAAPNQEILVRNILNQYENDILIVKKDHFGSQIAASSDFSIVASGTATLEFALTGVPIIAIYKTNFLSSFIGRKIINMDNIILPNWILGKKYIEFLFQENCNPLKISQEMIKLINNEKKIKSFNLNAKKLRKLLTANNITFQENVSNIIQHYLRA